MKMKKSAPKKGRIKVGVRVQLNKQPPGVTTDGTVISNSGKKASWNVEWRHKVPYETLVQSSKSLRLWRLDLTQIVLSSEDEKDEEVDDESAAEEEPSSEARDAEESAKKRKFDKFAEEQEGREFEVWSSFNAHFYRFLIIYAVEIGGR
jgi:hypothetical protein